MSHHSLSFCRNCSIELTTENKGSDLYCIACISICDKSFQSFKSQLDSNIRLRLVNVSSRDLTNTEGMFLHGSNIELANLYRDYIFPFVTYHQYQLKYIHSSRLYLELAIHGDLYSDLSSMDIYLYNCEQDQVIPDTELPYWNWINEITILINCEVNEAVAAVTELLEHGLLELTIRKGFTYFMMVPQTLKRGPNYSPDRVRENASSDGMWRE